MSFAISFSCSRSDLASHLGKSTFKKMILCAFKNAYTYLRNLFKSLQKIPHKMVTAKNIKIPCHTFPAISTTLSQKTSLRLIFTTDAINQLVSFFTTGCSVCVGCSGLSCSLAIQLSIIL
ncbi:hypothetical protein IJL65_05690 [bacterium]|nr:hypothetical protein [bacterium]